MAFRFQKRVKIAPGIRLNFSKSGVSASAGVRGATVNLSSKGVRGTAGIPGTGLSWSKQTGWAGARDLKPADELMQLHQLLEKLAKTFNSLSPKANKVTEGWNKAVESFEGGRGPSAAKFQTLQKRFEKAEDSYQKILNDAEHQRSTLEAIENRLDAMRFGFFSGKLKAAQKGLISMAEEHENAVDNITEAVHGLITETAGELSDAEGRI